MPSAQKVDHMDSDELTEAIKEAKSFNQLRQIVCHSEDIVTDTDKAIHARNLARAKRIKENNKKYRFHPELHKPSFIEDEFEEFR
jgi:hypothetical protein